MGAKRRGGSVSELPASIYSSAFRWLSWREGLRDITTCSNAKPEALSHLGFREPLAQSTLAEANEQRD